RCRTFPRTSYVSSRLRSSKCRADGSVELPDQLVVMSDGNPEPLHPHVVLHLIRTGRRQHLVEIEVVLGLVAYAHLFAGDIDADGTGRVGQSPFEPRLTGLPKLPVARARRFPGLVDDLLEQ